MYSQAHCFDSSFVAIHITIKSNGPTCGDNLHMSVSLNTNVYMLHTTSKLLVILCRDYNYMDVISLPCDRSYIASGKCYSLID